MTCNNVLDEKVTSFTLNDKSKFELWRFEKKNLTESAMGELVADKHVRYILMTEKKKESFDSVMMDHLRMNGAYWGLTTLALLEKLGSVSVDEVVSWLMTCQHESAGGFAGNTGHDPHVLQFSYYYAMKNALKNCLYRYYYGFLYTKLDIAGLQNEDGSFSGDIWGEVDTRFSYISICCLSILKCLDKSNVKKAVDYIVSCKNRDGGFGCTPGAESHAAQIFCCVGALAITGSLHHVCYSWWVLSSLIMIDRVHWINKAKLVKFILDCQVYMENGGISDRPEDAVDIYHTYLGVAGLSLLEYPGVQAIDPAYALPVDVINRIIINK
ncbi:unnamed protein product [Brassica napus]|uniref:Geranylgeranyl transferase type-2 subunit beta n=1 Tax=Brassica napus TaxID=3708 RepID=A0A816HZB3_BRANA|nr:unnamed protein product [Brassica napus]